MILMEVSDRAERERGVGLRVLKVHSKDSGPLLSRRVPVKTTFITHIDRDQPPPKHRPFDRLLEGSRSEAPDPGGALVSPPCCPQPSVFTEQISDRKLTTGFLCAAALTHQHQHVQHILCTRLIMEDSYICGYSQSSRPSYISHGFTLHEVSPTVEDSCLLFFSFPVYVLVIRDNEEVTTVR